MEITENKLENIRLAGYAHAKDGILKVDFLDTSEHFTFNVKKEVFCNLILLSGSLKENKNDKSQYKAYKRSGEAAPKYKPEDRWELFEKQPSVLYFLWNTLEVYHHSMCRCVFTSEEDHNKYCTHFGMGYRFK